MRLLITQTPNSPITLDAQTRRVFPAQISFEGYNTYPITVTDPFTPAQEAELEWYYERWLNFPFTDKIRAQHAAASIRTYGHDLFKQLFRADPNLYADYREQRHDPFTIEIIGEPEFHTLHWESLHDPDQDRPLTVDKAIIRRNHQAIKTPASVKESPTLNILLVTARPGGKLDVGYRTISRPLVDALENSQLPTRVDIVRPGTFKALVQHLEDSRDRHGDGYYQVIHLDMHGSLLTYAQYQQRETEWTLQRELFKTGYGQEPITEYDGVKAFLAFAGEQGGTDLVAADDLARVLNTRQVPIAILNACQSGKQVGAEETSLGSRLLTAGVQLVVAMGYSVTVSAARLLMTHLYQHLLQGDSLETAIRRARLELYHVKTRRAAFSQQIELEDWLLPVVYQHKPVRLNSKVFDWTALAQEAESAHKPPHTNYGFVGRDVDILEVERHLLRDEQSNLLLMRGMGGAGKTTLLHHLAWWWQKTRLVQRVFYFGYDVKAYHTQEIVATIALALFGKVDMPWLAVRQKLRAERHLLILDNMESITGERLAVQNTLPPAEQTTLRAFLADLVGGRTLILLGSRSDEKWLVGSGHKEAGQLVSESAGQQEAGQQSAGQQSAPNLSVSQSLSLQSPVSPSLPHLPTYDLPGLDPEAQSELAEAILQRLGKSHYRSGELHREPFRQLLKLLGGYPLAMEVVLNNLQAQTPAQVLEALTQADVALDKDADTGDKTKSILRCIDYSHGNLSPLAQDLLLCLAPFTGVVHTGLLPEYMAQLQKAWAEQPSEGLSHQSTPPQKPSEGSLVQEKPGFLTADTGQWQVVLQEAARWGLVDNHEVSMGYLRLQPVLPYFLKTRLHNPDQLQKKQVIEIAFCESYRTISQLLARLIRAEQPQERKLGQKLVALEYENLVTALKKTLHYRTSIWGLYSSLSAYIDVTQDHQLGLELGQTVVDALEKQPLEKYSEQILVELVGIIENIGNRYLNLKAYTSAENAYHQALDVLCKVKQFPQEGIDTFKTNILHNLGIVAQKQWDLDKAVVFFSQALRLKLQLTNLCNRASTLYQLGMVNQELGALDKAIADLGEALFIQIACEEKLSQAKTLSGLGIVFQKQKLWDKAQDQFEKSLDIFIEFDEYHEQAGNLHQLGKLYLEQDKLDRADDLFRKALLLWIQFKDDHSRAHTLQGLGVIAYKKKQWAEANNYLNESKRIFHENDDWYGEAFTLCHLGNVAESQSLGNDAYKHYDEAAQIFHNHDKKDELGRIFFHLGKLAQEQEDWTEATDYLFKALGIFAQFNDQHGAGIAIDDLARVWQESGQGAGIPARLAALLDLTPAQAEELLRAALAG